MSKKIPYSKDTREAAKAASCGMFTVSIVGDDGERIDIQRAARSLEEIKFLRWALAAIEAEECVNINLEALVLQAVAQ
jgi:hypothetical protein